MCPNTGRVVLNQGICTFWFKNPLVRRNTCPSTLHWHSLLLSSRSPYHRSLPILTMFQAAESDPTQLLLLNCVILSDKPSRTFNLNETFPVKVPKTDNVGILKKMIKEENPHTLDKVDAKDLILTQVSLPVDDGLAENLRRAELTPLNPVLPISQAFPRVEERHLHVVVQAPKNSEIPLVCPHRRSH